MAKQMAEQVVAIQNAAEESGCDSDCDLLVTDPVLLRLLRLEFDSCEWHPKLLDSVDLTQKHKFQQT